NDSASYIAPAAALTRAINKLCVTPEGAEPRPPFPPDFVCVRGGGFDDRYSLTNLGNEVDFEVISWVLRDSSRNEIERLDGNNLHFDPSELSEGDYSIEVAGITGWNSPFTVGASVLR
ncbi:MAG: hypothetical protein VXZ58_03235, partial [Actinomycetota bacterium]|nr:hypothetical protein [Actinomycetota bacterium]